MTMPIGATRAAHLGFTLIELLIAAAVLTVLVRLAYPSYKTYVVRTSREAAESQLLQLANVQERIFLNSGAYSTSVTGAYTGQSSGGLGSSGYTTDGTYAISCTSCTATAFTLTATPVSGKTQVGDGNLTVDQSGKRLWGSASW
jgi:type IV pilus assembly protein PilE